MTTTAPTGPSTGSDTGSADRRTHPDPLGRRRAQRGPRLALLGRDQPGHRPGQRPPPPRHDRGDGCRRGRGQGGVPGLARRVAGQAHADPVRVPRAAELPQGRARGDHHRRARQGALRRSRRGLARPGGRRVRLRHAAPAQGLDVRERLDRCGRALRAPAARASSGSSARSTSRRWCRCGSSRSRSRPATPSSSSRARRSRPRRCGWPSCGRRPVCRTASSTSCTATRRRSTRC